MALPFLSKCFFLKIQCITSKNSALIFSRTPVAPTSKVQALYTSAFDLSGKELPNNITRDRFFSGVGACCLNSSSLAHTLALSHTQYLVRHVSFLPKDTQHPSPGSNAWPSVANLWVALVLSANYSPAKRDEKRTVATLHLRRNALVYRALCGVMEERCPAKLKVLGSSPAVKQKTDIYSTWAEYPCCNPVSERFNPYFGPYCCVYCEPVCNVPIL